LQIPSEDSKIATLPIEPSNAAAIDEEEKKAENGEDDEDDDDEEYEEETKGEQPRPTKIIN